MIKLCFILIFFLLLHYNDLNKCYFQLRKNRISKLLSAAAQLRGGVGSYRIQSHPPPSSRNYIQTNVHLSKIILITLFLKPFHYSKHIILKVVPLPSLTYTFFLEILLQYINETFFTIIQY